MNGETKRLIYTLKSKEKEIAELNRLLQEAREVIEFYAGDQMVVKQSILAGDYRTRENGERAKAFLKELDGGE